MFTFFTSTLERAQVREWNQPQNVFIGNTDVEPKLFSEVNVSDNVYPPVCKNFHIWYKVASSYEQYDWYVRCDDDAFIDEERTKEKLRIHPTDRPVYTGLPGKGRRHERILENMYAQGGACEIMNREALQTILVDLKHAATHCHEYQCITPECHSDVELSRILAQKNIFFTTSTMSYGMFYPPKQLLTTVPTHINFYDVTQLYFPVVHYSLRGRPTFRWDVMHPVKNPLYFNTLTQLKNGQTPPTMVGMGLCNCTHVPRFIRWSTACCNQHLFSFTLPNRPMKCHEDHCSKMIVQCSSPKTRENLWENTQTYYAMISMESDNNRELRRRLSSIFSSHIHLFRATVGKTLFEEGIQSLTKGEIGYRETMYRLISHTIEEKKHLVSFDDDVLIHRDVLRMIKDISSVDECTGYLDDNPGGVLLLGASEWSKDYQPYVDSTQLCYNAFQRTLGSYAVFISRAVLPYILRWLRSSNRPFDHVWEYIQSIGFPVRVANPHLFLANVSKASTVAIRGNSKDDPFEIRRQRMGWQVELYSSSSPPSVRKRRHWFSFF